MNEEESSDDYWERIVTQGRRNRLTGASARKRVIKSNKLDYDSYLRKFRMLIEFNLKVSWSLYDGTRPTCHLCHEEITMDSVTARKPFMPVVDLRKRTISHALCADPDAERLQGVRPAVRVAALCKLATQLTLLHNCKCWYCEEPFTVEDFIGRVPLTLHHLDEDRQEEGVTQSKSAHGGNVNARLDILHQPCHKRHHKAPTTYKESRDRMNGIDAKRVKLWRYFK